MIIIIYGLYDIRVVPSDDVYVSVKRSNKNVRRTSETLMFWSKGRTSLPTMMDKTSI